MKIAVKDDVIIQKIHFLRGQRVMLDKDLAALYKVDTKRLNEQVRRNIDRFPKDFMFQLTSKEFSNLKSQNATSSWGGIRKLPYAFSEHGILMLSGVLNSSIAIKVNIQIIRLFVKMRTMMLTHKDILLKLEILEKNVSGHAQDIQLIFKYVKQLLYTPNPPRRKIGFIQDEEDS